MQNLAQATRIAPASKVDLAAHKPNAKLGLRNEQAARARTAKRAERMTELATKLMAEHKRSVLVVLQGMDASGKDGTVKHCIGGLNPMSVRIAGFKAPSSTELAHDFLWRVHQVLPERGEIGIFNRSHYEDVLVVRVEELVPKQVWKKRYAAINAFEAHLANEGTTVVKFFLNISLKEQAERFQARISDPRKNWKFSADDLKKRARWADYMVAYRAMLERTSTAAAPWHIVPSDHKWVRDAVVTEVLTQTLEGLDPKWPELAPELRDLVVE
jgi:PPK2 family polyphosphate:nucleotide phosphotransferase